ncbi:MAG: DUF2023 family protein [Spirochaetales bacterium]|nr:DUF2023 family protein [Spirochaetales bacterium]
MTILEHHIYELKKGLRDIALCTLCKRDIADALERLSRSQMSYFVQNLGPRKANIYFGNPECLQILQGFQKSSPSHMSPEEDFMLGIMLGYSRDGQYKRYQSKKRHCVDSLTSSMAMERSSQGVMQ